MSGVGSAIGSIFGPVGAAVGGELGNVFGLNNDTPATAPQPQVATPAASAPPPDPVKATTSAVQNKLAQEANSAGASTILTSGAGLLDQPLTASRVLLGG